MNTTKTKTTETQRYGDYGDFVYHNYEQTLITAGGRKDNANKITEIKVIHGCAIVSRLGREEKFYCTPTSRRLAN